MRVDIKMIVTDLDHTLLRSDKSVSNFTIDILNVCKQQGVLIAFATARSENDCKQYTDVIHPDAIVSSRGLLVSVGENIISRSALDIETTNKVISVCCKQPNVRYILAFTDRGTFSNIPTNENGTIWGKCNPDMYTDFSKALDNEAYDIVAEIFDNATVGTIASSVPTIDVKQISGQHWFSFGVKNVNKSINKLDGIKSLAAYFNIDLDDIVSFGDGGCDVEMLRGCGTGVAVDNAAEEVKTVADCVCDSNDNDGVAKWLESNVLVN
jgi:Cof subfamily protein (haloacid dehalogenase superfamily)